MPDASKPALYHAASSSASYRVRMALFVKQIEYEAVAIDLETGEHKTPAYRALNPQGVVPTLITPSGQPITQSMAIVQWLDDHYPDLPMLPQAQDLKYAVMAFCHVIGGDIHPLQGRRLANWLQEAGVASSVYPQIAERAILEGLAAAHALRRGVEGPFTFGSVFTAADIWLLAQLRNARRFKLSSPALDSFALVEAACQQAYPGIDRA